MRQTESTRAVAEAVFARHGIHQIKLCGGIGTADRNGTGIYAADVRKALDAVRGARTLTIVVDSHGGLAHEAKKIYALILAHPAPDKIAIVRNAASAALHIVLACRKRWAQAGAELLVHRIALDPGSEQLRWTGARHHEMAERLQIEDAALARFYAARTGHKASASWFARQMQDEKPMPLATALKCGLIHKIIRAPARSAPTARPSERVPALASRPSTVSHIPYFTRDMRAPGWIHES